MEDLKEQFSKEVQNEIHTLTHMFIAGDLKGLPFIKKIMELLKDYPKILISSTKPLSLFELETKDVLDVAKRYSLSVALVQKKNGISTDVECENEILRILREIPPDLGGYIH